MEVNDTCRLSGDGALEMSDNEFRFGTVDGTGCAPWVLRRHWPLRMSLNGRAVLCL